MGHLSMQIHWAVGSERCSGGHYDGGIRTAHVEETFGHVPRRVASEGRSGQSGIDGRCECVGIQDA